ncbi:MAG: hypothetical protein KIT09_26075 [Bryobacteraceae bacterium]|nr:hypothetical protein [Bryobacteraceae bacterium]
MLRTLFITAAAIALTLSGCSGPAGRETPRIESPPADPKILQFYASPGVIAQGDDVTICYGVENADRVEIAPKVAELSPSPNRCFSVTPEKSTVFRLTAAGNEREISAELAIEVRPRAQGAAQSFSASPVNLLVANAEEVAPGQQVTVCYGVTDVVSVRLDPPVRELQPRSSCFSVPVEKTTTFTVIAVDADNKEHTRRVTIKVK